MGYTTVFDGGFDINPPLSHDHKDYLQQFSEIRHLMRSSLLLEQYEDEARTRVGLPIGTDGEFFIAAIDEDDLPETLLDGHDTQPRTQPALHCDWTPSDDGTQLVWNGSSSFRSYPEWLDYLIANFLKPWGYTVTGVVGYQGEEPDDQGVLIADSRKVEPVQKVDFGRYLNILFKDVPDRCSQVQYQILRKNLDLIWEYYLIEYVHIFFQIGDFACLLSAAPYCRLACRIDEPRDLTSLQEDIRAREVTPHLLDLFNTWMEVTDGDDAEIAE
jgi:hypothetical protein